ncbi:MAG: Mrp/NBP35 family ATP-binding protein [Spirochaetota bacterium]
MEQQRCESLAQVKKVIVVMSGKGGVGKSTVSVNIAAGLAKRGFATGILDADLHGPSVAKMLKLNGVQPEITSDEKMIPVKYNEKLSVLSVAFLLPSEHHATIWRGPAKAGVLKQFIQDTKWGELDYLIIDCPPGTGDEPLSVIQLAGKVDGAIIVTTPQEVALIDVKKSITFAEKIAVPVYGIIENMAGFTCPHCGKVSHIFSQGGGADLALQSGIPLISQIPLLPQIGEGGDSGLPFMLDDSPILEETRSAISVLLDYIEKK